MRNTNLSIAALVIALPFSAALAMEAETDTTMLYTCHPDESSYDG